MKTMTWSVLALLTISAFLGAASAQEPIDTVIATVDGLLENDHCIDPTGKDLLWPKLCSVALAANATLGGEDSDYDGRADYAFLELTSDPTCVPAGPEVCQGPYSLPIPIDLISDDGFWLLVDDEEDPPADFELLPVLGLGRDVRLGLGSYTDGRNHDEGSSVELPFDVALYDADGCIACVSLAHLRLVSGDITVDVDLVDNSILDTNQEALVYLEAPALSKVAGIVDFGFPGDPYLNFDKFFVAGINSDGFPVMDWDDDGFGTVHEFFCEGQPTNPTNPLTNCYDWDGDGIPNSEDANPRTPDVIQTVEIAFAAGTDLTAQEAGQSVVVDYMCSGADEKVRLGAHVGDMEFTHLNVTCASGSWSFTTQNSFNAPQTLTVQISTIKATQKQVDVTQNITLLGNAAPVLDVVISCDAAAGPECTDHTQTMLDYTVAVDVTDEESHAVDLVLNDTAADERTGNHFEFILPDLKIGETYELPLNATDSGGQFVSQIVVIHVPAPLRTPELEGSAELTSDDFGATNGVDFKLLVDPFTPFQGIAGEILVFTSVDEAPLVMTKVTCSEFSLPIIAPNHPDCGNVGDREIWTASTDELGQGRNMTYFFTANTTGGSNSTAVAVTANYSTGTMGGVGALIPEVGGLPGDNYDYWDTDGDGDVTDSNGQIDLVEMYVLHSEDLDGRFNLHIHPTQTRLTPPTEDLVRISVGDENFADGTAKIAVIEVVDVTTLCVFGAPDGSLYVGQDLAESGACTIAASQVPLVESEVVALVNEILDIALPGLESAVVLIDEDNDGVPEFLDLYLPDPESCGVDSDAGPFCTSQMEVLHVPLALPALLPDTPEIFVDDVLGLVGGTVYSLIATCDEAFGGDGSADGCKQFDHDGDGHLGAEDNCPYVANEDQANLDGDAFGDACDDDIDGDGFTQDQEAEGESDPRNATSVPSDSDGDGVYDNRDAFPDDANETADADNDGVGDNADACDGFDDSQDLDEDGIPDGCDDDLDGDGFSNLNETDQGTDPGNATSFPMFDADGDSVYDHEDNCPSVSNENQANLDGDEFGDACDDDVDGDGVNNTADAFPTDSSEWMDTDGDGTGDNADIDDDNDGFSDAREEQEGTDPKDPNSKPTTTSGGGSGGDCGSDATVELCSPGTGLVTGALYRLTGVPVPSVRINLLPGAPLTL